MRRATRHRGGQTPYPVTPADLRQGCSKVTLHVNRHFFVARYFPSHQVPKPRNLMEFLKSAVASAISKGPPFPYTFGDKVGVDQSVWALFNGTRRVLSHLHSDYEDDDRKREVC